MATGRVVNTNFWKDSYIIDLDPIEKLLFLYFITNPRTTLAGIYEISLREVAFDTGIDKEMVAKILNRFQVDGKMYYEKNWLVLTNFIKNQSLNPSIVRGIEKAIESLPDWLQELVNIESNEDNQTSIFLSVTEQPGYSLGTATPQRKEIKRNIKKLKEIKSKQNKADESAGFKNLDKKNYAQAVRLDEDLKLKEQQAIKRPMENGHGYKKAISIAEEIKRKRFEK